MSLITLAALVPLLLAGEETERDAVLLECCTLPDKKLTSTEADLDGIVSRFTAAPVKLQHIDTPLDPLGTVQRVWRDGKRLLGRIAFPPAIAGFVRERGALALSCGLERPSENGPLSLSEVSLVIKGRIPAATLLADDERAELDRLRTENKTILQENTAQRVDAQIVSLKLAGKIVPATEAAARVLLSAGDTSKITLTDGNTQTVAEAFATFLAASPTLVTLGELTKLSTPVGSADGMGATGDAAIHLDTDQRDFLMKSLGVNPDDVIKTMQADKAKAAGQKGMATTASFPSVRYGGTTSTGLAPAPTAQQRGA